MDICSYIPEIHFNHIKLWLSDRNISEELAKELPKNSYIAILGKEFVGAAGLDIAETYGIICGMITNPKQSFNDRSRAVDLLTIKIIDRAKELKLKKLIGWTNHRGIFHRSLKHGFKEINHLMIGMELGE
jgi:hypothetical protein